jgi:hypothetical protein
MGCFFAIAHSRLWHFSSFCWLRIDMSGIGAEANMSHHLADAP